MKITKILRGLLIALSIMMIFALAACNIFDETETSDTSESIEESESVSESESESTSDSVSESESDSESESTSESETEPCKHANTTLNSKCDKICSDCNVTVATSQHVAGEPDATDKCNVKCVNCGKVMKTNQHTLGEPDANDNCNVKCTVCNEVVKTAQHTRGDGTPDTNDECKIKCPVCSATLAQSHGETSATWTPILGVAEDGKLYETKNCVDCGTARETRVVAKTGYLNTVKVGDIVAGSSKVVGSTITLVEGNNSGDTVIIAGWIGINGGVSKYVYRVIDADGNTTAWIDAVDVVAPVDMDATTHKTLVNAITGAKLGIADYEAKAVFTGGVKTGALTDYLGQTVTVEFAVVPANNAGTEEAPNTIVIASIANLAVACSHNGNTNEYKVTDANPQWLVCESCSICGAEDLKIIASETMDGLHMFSPSYIATKKGTLVEDENGFSYVRISSSKAANEETVWLFSNVNEPIENVGGYLAIIYRSTVSDFMDFYIDSTTTAISATSRTSKMDATGDSWRLVVQDLSSISKFDGEKLVALRFDYFNDSKDRTEEDYVDVAAIAFFDSKEAAEEYYAAYISAYIGAEGCGHYSTDGNWVGVEGQTGKIAETCNYCNSLVNITDCAHRDDSKLEKTEIEHAIFSHEATCTLCGVEGIYVVSDENQAGKHVFTPAYISGKKGSWMTDASGMEFVRIMSANPAGAEEFFNLYMDAESPLTNVGQYVAILYRSSVDNKLEFFMDHSSTKVTKSVSSATITASEQWQLIIIDTAKISDRYDGSKLSALRLDYFNNGANNRTANDYVDIAFISFFSSEEEIYEYYLAYVNEYLHEENCDHAFAGDWTFDAEKGKLTNTCTICETVVEKDCAHDSFSGEWTPVEGEAGKTQNTCATCGETIVKDCTEHSFTTDWTTTDNEGEIQNTCACCGTVVVKTCEHGDVEYTATENPFVFDTACAACGKDLGEVVDTNADGKHMFTPDGVLGAFNTTTTTDVLNYISVEKMTESELEFVRFEVIQEFSNEKYFYFTNNSASPVSGVSNIFAIMYRASEGNDPTKLDCYINDGSGMKKMTLLSTFVYDEEWHIMLFQAPEGYDTSKSATAIRFDIFNDGDHPVGAYVDIAYAGFFNSEETANEFYGEYVKLYGLCQHTEFSGEWTPVEGEVGKTQNTCATCGDTITKDCTDHSFTTDWTASETAGVIKNTCACCGTEVTEDCDHSDASKLVNTGVEHDIYDIFECTLCGVEGIEVVSNTNQAGKHVFTPEYISGIKGSLMTDANGMEFVRIVPGSLTSAEENFFIYSNDTAITGAGGYLVILYRSSIANNELEIFINSNSKSITAGDNKLSGKLEAGSEWQLVIFDLTTKANFDEETVKALRLDYINGNPTRVEGDYVDIAYISFFSSKEEAHAYYGAYVAEYIGAEGCGHYVTDGTWIGTGETGKIGTTCTFCQSVVNITDCHHEDASKITKEEIEHTIFSHEATCTLCGADGIYIVSDENQVGNHVFTPEYISGKKGTWMTDANGMEFVRIMSANPAGAEEFFNLYMDAESPLTNVGQYVAILYRSSVDNKMELFMDRSSTKVTVSVVTPVIEASEQWQLVIVDTAKIADRYDGSKLTALRLDYFNNGANNRTTSDYVDIAFVSFFASKADIYEYYLAYLEAYIGAENCDHEFAGDWTYDAELGKFTNTCTICETVVEKDCEHTEFTGEWTVVEGETGKIQNTCATCGETIVKTCEDHIFTTDWVATENEGEIKNTCSLCGTEVVKVCEHENIEYTSTSNPFIFNIVCAECGCTLGEALDTNADGKHMFTPDKILGAFNVTSPNSTFNYISVEKMTESEMDFIHFEVTNDFSSEKYLYFTNASTNAISKAGNRFAIMYRASSGMYAGWDLFVSNATSGLAAANKAPTKTIVLDEEWHLVIFDVSAAFDSGKSAGTIRLDIFNSAATAGTYVDIAFAGFFGSDESASEFYGEYLELYGLCKHAEFSGDWTLVEGEDGKIQNTCAICGETVIKDCVDHIFNSDWTVTETGEIQNTCSACGEVVTKACDHSDVSDEWVGVEGQIGKIAHTCNICQALVGVTDCDHSDASKLEDAGVEHAIFDTYNCTLCGVNGIEVVSAENQAGKYVFTPEYISGKKGTLITDANGMTYVRINAKNANYEENVTLFANAQQPITNVGGYLAIVYRSTVSDFMDFYIDSNTTSISKTARTGTLAATGDKWSLVIQDLSSVSTYDGEKLVALRFDYFNDSKNRTEADYVDVAYISFFATEEEAREYYAAYVTEYLGTEGCRHYTTDGTWIGTGEVGKIGTTCTICNGTVNVTDCHHTDESKITTTEIEHTIFSHELTCTLCGADGIYIVSDENQVGNHVFTPEYISGKKGSWMTDENGMGFVRIMSANPAGAEEFFNLYMDAESPLTNVGQYVAILYRSSVDNKMELFMDRSSTKVTVSVVTPVIEASEQWQLVIVDTAKIADRYDGSKLTALRLDYFNNGANNRTVNDYVDIAFISFFDSEADIYEYYLAYLEAYIGEENCDHEFTGDWTYDAELGKFVNTCAICGNEIVNDCEHDTLVGEWTGVEGQIGKIQNTCATCGATVVKDCTDHSFTTDWTVTENEGEIKNTCASCGAEVVKACDHKSVEYTVSSNPFIYNSACAACGKDLGEVKNTNADGKHMFDADGVLNAFDTTSGSGIFDYISAEKMTDDDSEMEFVRFEVIQAFSNEKYFYFANNSTSAISKVGTIFAIMYRANEGNDPVKLDAYINDGSGMKKMTLLSTFTYDEEWNIMLFQAPEGYDTSKSATALRFDIFNDGNHPVGTYVDIAFAGFFASSESANEFYGEYLDLYGLCQHAEFTGDWTLTEDGKIQNTCAICGDVVVKDCVDHIFNNAWIKTETAGVIKNTCSACGTEVTKTCEHSDVSDAWVSGGATGKKAHKCNTCDTLVDVTDCDHSDASKLTDTGVEHDIFDTYNCTLCGVEGIEVVSTENQAGKHVFTPEYISGMKGSLVTDANGMTYVRIMSTNPSATEENVWLYKNVETPLTGVGQYVAILFRTSVNNNFEIFVDSNTTNIKKNIYSSSLTAGEQWQLAIIDLKIDGTYYDGEKLVALRFDYFNNGANNRTTSDYVDIAYISFFSSKEDAHAYYGAYVAEYLGAEGCGHYSNNGVWTGVAGQTGKIGTTCTFCQSVVNITDCHHEDASKITMTEIEHTIFSHEATCTLCGADGIYIVSDENQVGNHVFTPEYISGKKGTLMTDANGMEFVRIMSTKDSGEEYFNLYMDAESPLENVGQYVAILYRSSVDNKLELFMDRASTKVTISVATPTIGASEQWQLVIIDTSKISDRYDGSKLAAFRFDYFNGSNTRTTSDYVDIAFVSFFSSEAEIYEYYLAYLDEYIGAENCDHEFAGDWTFDAEKGKFTNTCTICESLVEKACEHTEFSGEWTAVEGQTGKLQNTCAACGATVVKDCTEHTFTTDWTATGTEGEIKNTCSACGTEVVKVCDHGDVEYTATEVPFIYDSACAECGKDLGEVVNTNADGKHMFTPDKILGAFNVTSPNSTFNYISAEKKTESGMDYIHFEVTNDFSSEKYVYFANATTSAISKTSTRFAIMYRASQGAYAGWDLFVSNATTGLAAANKAPTKTIVLDEEWHLVIFDVSAAFDSGKSAGTIRLDIFNSAATAGTYVDIAFAGFFGSDESASEFYGEYLNLYGLCKHAEFTGDWTSTADGKIQNTCAICGETVVKDCVDHIFNNAWTKTETAGVIKNTCSACGTEITKTCDHSDVSDAWVGGGATGKKAHKCNTCDTLVDVTDCDHSDASKLTDTGVEHAIYDTYNCTLCGVTGIKVVSNTNQAGKYVFTPEYISGKKGTLITDANGMTFVRINAKNAAYEENVTLFANAQQPITNVGGYLAIVYRSTVSDFMDFYIDSNTTSISKTARTGTLAGTGDKWSLVIQDLSSVSTYDGEKLVALRFDYFNDSKNRTEADYVDVAYISFFATEEEAREYYAAYVTEYLGTEGCRHYTTDGTWIGTGEVGKIGTTCTICNGTVNVTDCHHTDESKITTTEIEHTIFSHELTCTLCGADGIYIVSDENQVGNHVFTPEYISGKKGSWMTDANGMGFVRIMSANPAGAEEFFNLYMDAESPLTNVGQYVAILYRSSVDNKMEIFMDRSSTKVTVSVVTPVIEASEQWQLVIIDTAKIADRYDGSKLTALRLDYFNNGANNRTVNDYVDIAFISFFASEEDIYEYYLAYLDEYIGEENCDHAYANDWTYDAEKGKFTNSCTICGSAIEKACEHAEVSGDWTRVEGQTGKLQNTCATCGATVVKDCTDHSFTTDWTATENEGEIKNTCASCGSEVVKACDHKSVEYTVSSNPFIYNSACAACGKDLGEVKNTNADGKHMFDADGVFGAFDTTSGSGIFEYISVEKMTENEMDYIHFEVIKEFSNEKYFYFANNSTSAISKVGTIFAIMYRANEGNDPVKLDAYINDGSGMKKMTLLSTFAYDEEWNIMLFQAPEGYDTSKSATALRFDIFNDGNHPVGTYVDIAFAGFFASSESANEFYGAYLKLYGLCKHTAFSGEWTLVESGKIQNTCAICGDVVVKDCVDHIFNNAWTKTETAGVIKNTCSACGTEVTKTCEHSSVAEEWISAGEIGKIGQVCNDCQLTVNVTDCDHSDADKLAKTDAEHDIYDIYNCTLCGVEGIEIVSTENQAGKHVFTPEYISGKKGTLITDENGMTFVRIMSTNPSANEENVWLYKDAEAPLTGVGQYLAILFRSSVNNQFEIFVDSNSVDIKKNLWSPSFTAGEQWQLLIIDLKIDGTYYDGEQLVALRFDHFNNGANNRTEEDYVDIAYISFFSSKEDAHEYYGAYVAEYLGAEGCGHYANDGEWIGTDEIGKIGTTCIFCNTIVNITDCHHTDDEKIEKTEIEHPIFSHTAKCTLCGVDGINIVSTENQAGNHVFTPEYISSKKGTWMTDANGMEFVRIMSGKDSGEEYFTLFADKASPLTNVGRYIAILYRSTVDNKMEIFLDYASVNVTGSVNFKASASEQWQLVIVDTNSLAGTRYNGEKLVALRFDYFNNVERTTEDYIDIASITFFDEKTDAYAYYLAYLNEYIGEENCYHEYAGEWIFDIELGKFTNACLICGNVIVRDCEDHTFEGEWTYDAEKGKLTNTCTICGATVEKDCEDHTFEGEWTFDVELGKLTNTCTICGTTVEKDCDEHTFESEWTFDAELGKLTNTCSTCKTAVEKDCEHNSYAGNWVLDVELGKLTNTCAICGAELEKINDNYVFDADATFDAYSTTAPISNYTYISTVLSANEGEIKFVHFELIEAINGERSFYITNASGSKVSNAGSKFAIMYRGQGEIVANWDLFVSNSTAALNAGNLAGQKGITLDGNWHIVIFNMPESFDASKAAATIRLDIFNGKGAVGAYIDIAYAGFFDDNDTANEFYKAYLRNYNACAHAFNSEWVGVADQIGKVQNTCTICNSVVVKDCDAHTFSGEWIGVEGQIGKVENICTTCGITVVKDCDNHIFESEWVGVDGEIGKIKNTCVTCGYEIVKDCDHEGKLEKTDVEHDIYDIYHCTLCGATDIKVVSDKNQTGKHVFTPEYISGKKGSLMTDANGIEFVRIMSANPSAAEEAFILYSDKKAPLTNVGQYIAILYRSSVSNRLDFYMDHASEKLTLGVVSANLAASEEWQLVIIDTAKIAERYDGTKLTTIRFDYFNGAIRTEDDYVDVAFITFFSNEEDINAYYRAYLNEYGLCDHEKLEGEWTYDAELKKFTNTCTTCGTVLEKDCEHSFEGEWTPVEGEIGKTQNVCASCGETIVKECTEHSFTADWTTTENEGEIKNTCACCGTEVIKTCEHTFEGAWITTENAGEIKNTCTICGVEVVKACEHEYGEWTPVEGEIGQTQHTCTICNTTETKTCEEHVFTGDWTAAENAGEIKNTCACCGTEVVKTCDEHVFTEDWIASENVGEIKNTCSVCGLEVVKTCDEHVFTEDWTASENAGEIKNTCSVCGLEIVKACDEHILGEWTPVEGEIGKTQATCTICNHVEIKDCEEHTFEGDWIVTENEGELSRTCATCGYVELKACEHKEINRIPTNIPFIFDTECAVCKKDMGQVVNTNVDGKHMFTAVSIYDAFNTTADTTTIKYISTEKMNENSMDFVRFEVTQEFNGEKYFYLTNNSANPVSKIGEIFAIMYRAGEGNDVMLDAYINDGNGTKRMTLLSTFAFDEEWHIALYQAPEGCDTTKKATVIRLDIFESGRNADKAVVTHPEDSYVDIAYAGFFNTEETANEFYKTYLRLYDLCDHGSYVNEEWTGVEGQPGKVQNTCTLCDGVVIEYCHGHSFSNVWTPVEGEIGWSKNTCDICADVVKKACEDHTFASQWVPTENAGEIKNTCAECATEVVKPCEHTYEGEWTPVEGENGMTGEITNTCDVCGHVETRVCDHPDSENDVWTPVEGQIGQTQKTCPFCQYVLVVTCEDHDLPEDAWTPTGNGIEITNTCTKCATVVTKDCEHENYTGDWTYDAEKGMLTKTCATCGFVAEKACEHESYTGDWAPVGDKSGNLQNTCAICAEVIIKACTEHSIPEDTWIPAEGQPGKLQNACTICEKVEVKDCPGHVYENATNKVNSTIEYVTTCTVCNLTFSKLTADINKAPMVVQSAKDVYNTLKANGAQHSFFQGFELLQDEDGTGFVRITSNGSNGDPYAYIYKPSSVTETGRYLTIRYRLPASNSGNTTMLQVFASTTNAGMNGNDTSGSIFPVAKQSDNEWRTLIIDLTENGTTYTAAEDGSFSAKYVRLDFFGNAGNKDGDYFDIQFIAFSDKLNTNVSDGVTKFSENTSYFSKSTGTVHDFDQFNGLMSWLGDEKLGGQNIVTEPNGLTYNKYISKSSSEQNITIHTNSTALKHVSDYLAIIYRAPKTVMVNGTRVDNNISNTEIFVHSTATGAQGGCSKVGNYTMDGTWKVMILDFSSIGAAYDPATGLTSLRFDFFNPGSIAGAELHVAAIGFVESKDAGEAWYDEFLKAYYPDGQTEYEVSDVCAYGAHTNFAGYVPAESVDGTLREHMICASCGAEFGERNVWFRGWINEVYYDGAVVSGTSVNAYYEGKALSLAGKGTASTVGLKGWMATESGVNAYYYRVNGGEWIKITSATVTSGASTGIKDDVNKQNMGIVNYGTNCNMTKITTGDLTANYAGQTVTIEFGFCPNNQPGTEEAPNVISFKTFTNVEIATAQ